MVIWGGVYGAFVVGFEKADFVLGFAWFLESRFGDGFEDVDFAKVLIEVSMTMLTF